jgi:hypothetical protein
MYKSDFVQNAFADVYMDLVWDETVSDEDRPFEKDDNRSEDSNDTLFAMEEANRVFDEEHSSGRYFCEDCEIDPMLKKHIYNR